MCGISAMLGSPDAEIVKRMTKLQSHRGPDGSGVWSDELCSLGHSRLSIVDITGSNQPILSDKGVVLIHNGEIYNHSDLRNQTSQYSWTTKGDSETIIALHSSLGNTDVGEKRVHSSDVRDNGLFRYEKGYSEPDNPASRHLSWVSKLDGVWGFILWDPVQCELILSRDVLGVKPLVRTIAENSLLVGSEAKAFRAHEGYHSELDMNSLVARLAYEYSLDNTTLFKNVIQVAPGSIETWKLDENNNPILTGVAMLPRMKIKQSNSWNPLTDAKLLLESLGSSIADRLMSDVPLGIVLSGGLDSSLIVALAKSSAELKGVSVPECWTVAEDEDNPDWIAAELVASEFDIPHHQHTLEPDLFWKYMPRLSWNGEDLDVTVAFFQPLFETMSKEVKVGLCGQGADELHAGYSRYANLQKHSDLVTSRLNSCSDGFAQNLMGFGKNRLVSGEGKGLPWNKSTHIPDENYACLEDTLQFELNNGQLSNFQLRLVDRHSMGNGLEVRVPFLGNAHLESSSNLPMEWRLGKSPDGLVEKIALREAAKLSGLPDSIIHRPKLAAGTATSPSLLDEFIHELKPRIDEIILKNPSYDKLLRSQQDLAIGLALFQSVHVIDNGIGRDEKGVVELVDDYLSET